MEPLDPKLARLVHDGMVEAVPDQAREDRVLLGLLARLPPPGGPPGGDGGPGLEGASAAGSAGAAAGGKAWVLAVVLGAAAVTGGVVLGGRRGSEQAVTREPARSGAAASKRPEPAAKQRMPAPELAPTQPTQAQPTVPDATRASTTDPRPLSTHERERPSTARRAAGEAAVDRPPTPEPTTPAPADDELSAEIQQIAAADRALARGEALRALQLAREHAKDHPHGQLAREREAIELGARCLLDEPGAAEAAAAFVRAHADAPAAAKVRARCPGTK